MPQNHPDESLKKMPQQLNKNKNFLQPYLEVVKEGHRIFYRLNEAGVKYFDQQNQQGDFGNWIENLLILFPPSKKQGTGPLHSFYSRLAKEWRLSKDNVETAVNQVTQESPASQTETSLQAEEIVNNNVPEKKEPQDNKSQQSAFISNNTIFKPDPLLKKRKLMDAFGTPEINADSNLSTTPLTMDSLDKPQDDVRREQLSIRPII